MPTLLGVYAIEVAVHTPDPAGASVCELYVVHVDSPGAWCWKMIVSVGVYPASPVNVTVSVRDSPSVMVVWLRRVVIVGV